MSLPNNTLHTNLVPRKPFLSPDNHQRVTKRYDYERGGVALNDPTQGINGWDWYLWYNKLTGAVSIARLPEAEEIILFTAAGITSLSLSFDQNMRPTVAYMQAGECKLYWYDSALQAIVHTTFAGAVNPLLTMDDKRDGANQYNDTLFFYVKDGYLRYRQQRDRYTIERTLQEVPTGEIVQVGMCTDLRVRVLYRPLYTPGVHVRKYPCITNDLVICPVENNP